MGVSKIEWTDTVWNPVSGCTPCGPGCQNCYARRMATRLAGRFGYDAAEPFRVALHEDRLALPSRWRKPRRIFVCSMGDLFHEAVPDEYIWRVLDVATRGNRRHTYQILTKRPARMCEWFAENERRFWHAGQGPYVAAPWPDPCLWLGVSCENQAMADLRVGELVTIGQAAIRFVSLEPLLGPVIVPDVNRLDWVIVGAETGPHRRPMDLDWARAIRDQCIFVGVPFFFKAAFDQHGHKTRLLDGREWNEMPQRTDVVSP